MTLCIPPRASYS